jgi:hypothetical protein
MNDNDEIAVTMWRALEKADTPEAGGIVLAKLVATWLGGYRPLDRSARWSEFQHTMRQELAARDRRFFGERVVPGGHTDDEGPSRRRPGRARVLAASCGNPGAHRRRIAVSYSAKRDLT